MNDKRNDSPRNKSDDEDTSPDVPEWLGSQLRELYSDVVNEPMPDKFRDLLKQLEEKSGK